MMYTDMLEMREKRGNGVPDLWDYRQINSKFVVMTKDKGMVTDSANVIKVSFHDAVDGKCDYYFGSLKAIYSVFTAEQIGCGLITLYGAHISLTKKKATDKCVISKHRLIRSKHRQEK